MAGGAGVTKGLHCDLALKRTYTKHPPIYSNQAGGKGRGRATFKSKISNEGQRASFKWFHLIPLNMGTELSGFKLKVHCTQHKSHFFSFVDFGINGKEEC